MKTVPLHGKHALGRVALVDDEDYELVMAHRWRVFEKTTPGRQANGPYARTVVRRSDGSRWHMFMHALIAGYAGADHINHDGLDNRRINLRPATVAQNAQNRRRYSSNTSGFKGVYLEHGRWRAHIGHPHRHLGCFATKEEAARAYDAAALAMWGEYAHLNFPQGGA